MVLAAQKVAIAKPLFYTIPEGFDPRSVLQRYLWHRLDDAMWFVSTVLKKTFNGQTDRYGYVRMNRQIYCRVMSERTATPIVRAIVDAGIMEHDGYRIGEYSRGFRFTSPWLAMPVRQVPVSDPRLIKRVFRELSFLKQLRLARRLPVHDDLDRVQRELLTIDQRADELVASFTDANVRHQQEALLAQLRCGRPGRRSFAGRWYTPFCGCKRAIRPYFQLAGEPLAGYDLRCAQPALTAILLSPQIIQFSQCVGAYVNTLLLGASSPCSGRRPLSLGRDPWSVLDLDYIRSIAAGSPACGSDLGLFAELTRSAEFYGFLLARARSSGVDLGSNACDRSDLAMVKILILQDVLAKRGSYPSDFERIFKEAFPTVHRAIRWINSHRSPPDGCGREDVHGKLIRILQRMESALAIETVCPLILGRDVPVVPLHDCLYARQSDIALVEQGFEEAFDRCGVRLRLKRDVPFEQYLCTAN